MSEKPPAGWYPDSTNTIRWWDGEKWTDHKPPPPPTSTGPAVGSAASEPDSEVTRSKDLQRTDEPSESTAAQAPVHAALDSGSGKGLAMTALGVAVVSLLLCWIPIVNNVVFFLGVIGLVLAAVAYRRALQGKAEGRGMAFAAILISVLSVIGVIATQAFYDSILTDVEDAVKEELDGDSSQSDKEQAAEAKALPLGESAKVGPEYSVAVTKVDLNADRVVASTNEFNEPPKGRYVIATLRVNFTGTDEGDPWVDLEPRFVGSDARQYDAAACQAVVPDAAVDVPTLNEGGKATFKVCFDVPPKAISDGKMFVDESSSLDDASRVYWAIR